jgi:GH15 family glucan-1,4-alpha-glucosidase
LSSGSNTVRDRFKKIKRSDLLSYKAISDYGLIGDMKTCALIGIDGSIDWLCIPRFDSPSVFGAILDSDKGGRFLISPVADSFETAQAYEPLTNVLQTCFSVNSSKATLTDFMPCFEVGGTLISTGELHRRIECTEGEMNVEARFEPRPGYGEYIPVIGRVKNIGYVFSSPSYPNQGLTILTSLEFEALSKGTMISNFEMKEGEKRDFVLRFSAASSHRLIDPQTEIKLQETREYWKRWIDKCKFSGKWRDQVLRSALALKLLVYSPTGAIVAAPTTSLPEEIGGTRNWDYRYSWIRDSSFVIWSFHSLGFSEEATSYLDWLLSAFCLTIGALQPMLGITGDRDLIEKSLEHLSGYKGSYPARIGNDAWKQFQLDLYGILIDALYFSHKHARGIDRKVFDYLIRPMIDALEEMWIKPDCGIWEVRSEKKHFVYSKMWAWVGVDRALKIATERGYTENIDRWSTLREKIRKEIFSKGFDEELQTFVRSYGSKELDAANLLMPQVGFISAADPKMKSTIDATIKNLLAEDKFVYRYLTEDGLPGKEGAFLICSFWLVNCLTLAGRVSEAQKLLDSMAGYANHLGLFSEELDPETGNMLGNFPQAFTHMGFITAAVNLNRAIENANLRTES